MAVNRSKTKNEEVRKNEIKVLRVHQFNDGNITLNVVINGVTIYNMGYKEYKDKDGNLKSFYTFPSKKGSDGKYYNLVYIKLTDEDIEEIDRQIESLL